MPGDNWFDNDAVDEALALARQTQKPLLIDFWSATCLGCAKLVKLTYADATVQRYLADRFVAVKFQTSRTPERFKELNRAGIHMWHPHLVVADSRLMEARRVIGYLPSSAFIAELEIGRGVIDLFHRRYAEARDAFSFAASLPVPDSTIGEALYWQGVAAYRLSGQLSDLKVLWEQIHQRFPGSSWSHRADCLDIEIPDSGFDARDASTVTLTSLMAVAR